MQIVSVFKYQKKDQTAQEYLISQLKFPTVYSVRRWNNHFKALNPQEWLSSTFSFQNHPWIKHYVHENKENDNKLEKLSTFKQILFVSSLGNVYRTVWRICILMLE